MTDPFAVFAGRVRGVILGKQSGDFRLENPESLRLFEDAAAALGIQGGRLILPVTATGDDVSKYSNVGVYGQTDVSSIDHLRWRTDGVCDGFMLSANGRIGIGFMPADCPVVVLFAEKRKESFLALLHCGWKGVASGIISKAVGMMLGLGMKHTDIVALAITGIGPCCYEVTKNVRDVFVRKFGFSGFAKLRETENGSVWSLDLLRVIGNEIEDSDIRHFTVMRGCTKCDRDGDRDRFWSHRRGDKERNLVAVALA